MPVKKAEYLVSIDPSSTCTGCAVFCLNTGELVEASKIKPKASDDAISRVLSTTDDITELLSKYRPTEIVIEYVSQHVNINRHKGKGAGLAVYGFAVGAIWETTMEWWYQFTDISQPRLITPEQWTKGKKKKDRIDIIAALYPMYNRKNDKGGDVADAIGLGEWWLTERKLK